MNLFIGVPLTPELQVALNSKLAPLFKDYLTEVKTANGPYLGKATPHLATVEQLDNLESHINSLVKRLAPSYTTTPCQLITSSL